jgi:hypothetical protein
VTTPVPLTSGANAPTAHMAADPAPGFLSKPFRAVDLLAAVSAHRGHDGRRHAARVK